MPATPSIGQSGHSDMLAVARYTETLPSDLREDRIKGPRTLEHWQAQHADDVLGIAPHWARESEGPSDAVGSTAIFRELTGAGIFPVFTIATLGWVVLSAAVVGVAFGTYPARLAARFTPVEAIQRE
jgi:ABC-type antimicrobial peptide transport system permease subunit